MRTGFSWYAGPAGFAAAEVGVVHGGVEVAGRFSGLPFDHLIYTGGAPIARHVMRAAANPNAARGTT